MSLQQRPATGAGSAERLPGRDSPVSAGRSSRTDPLMIRASAQARSPSVTTSTSPGTRPRAATSHRAPSRTTLAVAGRNAARATASAGDPPNSLQHGGERQQDRQRPGELGEQLARPATPATAGQLVRAVHHQPPRGLPARQARPAGARVRGAARPAAGVRRRPRWCRAVRQRRGRPPCRRPWRTAGPWWSPAPGGHRPPAASTVRAWSL